MAIIILSIITTCLLFAAGGMFSILLDKIAGE